MEKDDGTHWTHRLNPQATQPAAKNNVQAVPNLPPGSTTPHMTIANKILHHQTAGLAQAAFSIHATLYRHVSHGSGAVCMEIVAGNCFHKCMIVKRKTTAFNKQQIRISRRHLGLAHLFLLSIYRTPNARLFSVSTALALISNPKALDGHA